MQIAVVSHKFSSGAVKFIKMFCLALLKINLNTVPKTVIFGIYGYVLIELLYCIFVENIMVSHLNLYAVVKKDS